LDCGKDLLVGKAPATFDKAYKKCLLPRAISVTDRATSLAIVTPALCVMAVEVVVAAAAVVVAAVADEAVIAKNAISVTSLGILRALVPRKRNAVIAAMA